MDFDDTDRECITLVRLRDGTYGRTTLGQRIALQRDDWVCVVGMAVVQLAGLTVLARLLWGIRDRTNPDPVCLFWFMLLIPVWGLLLLTLGYTVQTTRVLLREIKDL